MTYILDYSWKPSLPVLANSWKQLKCPQSGTLSRNDGISKQWNIKQLCKKKRRGGDLHVMKELSSRYIVRWRGGAEPGGKERGSGWLRTKVKETDLLTFESCEYSF